MDVIIAAIITVFGLIAAAILTPVIAAMVQGKKNKTPEPPAPLPNHPPEQIPTKKPDIICNILRERNLNFTGRKDTLETLRDNLLKGENAALTQVMKGMGGVGKTEIALEYAHEYVDEYTVIWWLRSEEPESLAEEFAALASRLDISPDIRNSVDQKQRIQAVKAWLDNHKDWLLIFDNVEEEETIQKYLPPLHKGHIIVTTRRETWQGGVSIPVDIMDEKTALDFLHKKTGTAPDNKAKELVQELGYLPLALEQAGAFMKVRRVGYGEYLSLFQTRMKEMLKQGKVATGYEQTIFTTWDISREKLQEESPAGEELLKLAAFLAPENIPLQTIRNEKEFLPELLRKTAEDDLLWGEMLESLQHYSLAAMAREENSNQTLLSLHRLFQSVIFHKMSEEKQKEYAGIAVKILRSAYPFKEHQLETWKPSGDLLPHALAAANHGEKLWVEPKKSASLLNLSGDYLRIRADFEASRKLIERALHIAEIACGKESTEVALYANNLGFVYKIQGNFTKARELYELALRIIEKVQGKDHPHVLIHLNNIGEIYFFEKNFSEARKLFQRIVDIHEKKYKNGHPNVAVSLNNLGMAEQSLGNLEDAKKLHQQALDINKKEHGEDHPTVARDLNNLAGIYQDKGNGKEAIKLYKQALKIYRKKLGEKHPDVAHVLNNLGLVLKKERKLKEAEDLYCEALDIFTTIHGPDHHLTQLVSDNLKDLRSKKQP